MTPEEQADLIRKVEQDRAERERAAFIRSAGEPPEVDTRLSFTKTQNLPQPDVSEPTVWLSTPHTNSFAAAAAAWARMAAETAAHANGDDRLQFDLFADAHTGPFYVFDEAADFLNGGHQDGDPVDEGPIPGDKEPTQRVFTGELPTDIIDAGATGRPWSPTEAEILADPDDAVDAIDQLAQLAPVHAPWLTITTRRGPSAGQPITIGYRIPSITTMPA